MITSEHWEDNWQMYEPRREFLKATLRHGCKPYAEAGEVNLCFPPTGLFCHLTGTNATPSLLVYVPPLRLALWGHYLVPHIFR